MGVEITKVAQKFFNQWDNGETLVLNDVVGYVTDFLMANAGELLRTEIFVSVSWTAESTATDIFTISGNTLTRSGSGDFIADGFVLGDIIDIWELTPVGAVVQDRTITGITANTIDFDGLGVVLTTLTDGIVYGKTPLEAFYYSYGLIENNSVVNFVSKIDGTALNQFYASGVGVDTGGGVRDTSDIPMTEVVGVNSWKDGGNAIVNYATTGNQTDKFAQVFRVQHIFRLLPFYLDGWQNNLNTLAPPSPEWVGTECLKYVFDAEFRQNINNPNGVKAQSFSLVQGNTGWLDERFNGLTNNFSIQQPVIIEDTINLISLNALDYQNLCHVTITIISANNVFNGDGVNISVGIARLPDSNEYEQNQNTINENFVFDYLITNIGDPPKTSDFIKNYDITGATGGTATIEFDVDYSVAQQSLLQNKKYMIIVGVADQSTAGAHGVNSERVMLLAQVEDYIFTNDVYDLMFLDAFKFVPHDKDDADPSLFDDYKGWVEDGFQLQAPFKLNTDLGASISSLKLDIIVFNEDTNSQFTIQTNSFDLTGSVIVGGVQQININTQNNFLLNSASDFKKVELNNTGSGVHSGYNVEEYLIKRGLRINFEEWIQLISANTQYFNGSQLNNGLNLLTSNYSTTLTFPPPDEMKVRAKLEASVQDPTGASTNYQFISEPLEIYYYHLDDNRRPHWLCDIEIYDLAGNLINAILTDAECEIKATFTKAVPFEPDLVGAWGWIRLDVQQGTINTPYELSTMNPRLVSGNPLIPLPTETFTKITNLGTSVILECRVDPTNIPSGSVLAVSARVSSSNDGFETWEIHQCFGDEPETFYTSTNLNAYIGQVILTGIHLECYEVIGTSTNPPDYPLTEPITILDSWDDSFPDPCDECNGSVKLTEIGGVKQEEDLTTKIIE